MKGTLWSLGFLLAFGLGALFPVAFPSGVQEDTPAQEKEEKAKKDEPDIRRGEREGTRDRKPEGKKAEEKPVPGQEPPPPEKPTPEPPPAEKPPAEEPPPQEPPPPETPAQEPPPADKPPAEEPTEEDTDDDEEDFDFDEDTILFEVKKGEKPTVFDLLRAVNIHLERPVVPEMGLDVTQAIEFLGPVKLNYPLLRIVLEMHDVKLIHESTKDGSEIIKAIGATPTRGRQSRVDRTPVETGGRTDLITPEMVTQIYRLEHNREAGSSLSQTLRQLKGPAGRQDMGVVHWDQGTQAFIIRDTRENVEYILEILEALDVPSPGRVFEVIQLQHAGADVVASTMEMLLMGGGVPGRPGVPRRRPGQPVQPGQPQLDELEADVIPDTRTNKLIVWADPSAIEQIQMLIAELDVRVPLREGKIHIKQLKDTQAEDMANVLNAVISGTELAQPGQAAPGGGTPTPQVPQTRRLPRTGTTGRFQQPTGVGEVATRIVPDAQTNSLIIQAEPEVYRELEELIEKLDTKKRQIFIEAQIWEVGVDTSLDLAVELTSLDRPVPGKTRGGGLTNFGLSTIEVDDPANPTRLVRIPIINEGVTSFLMQGAFDRIPIALNALATSSNARILSTPFALTNDNETATFTITDRVPFQTSTVAGTGLAQGGFDFADSTTTLEIEPSISSDDRLRLRVVVDIQTFTAAAGTGGAPPPSNSRKYEGVLTVPDRKYVVVGGLEQEEAVEDIAKVPVLGDIPLLGLLFQARQTIKRRTRIFFFIKPTIFVDPDYQKLTESTQYLQGGLKRFSTFDYQGEVLPGERPLSTREQLGRLFPSGKMYKLREGP